MMKREDIIVRYGEPSKYDQAPYGTLCKRIKTMSEAFEMYIQTSKNDTDPCWEKVGIFYPETEALMIKEVNEILNMRNIT